MKLYINPCTDPFYNLALEEYILTRETEGDFLLLWQNRPSVILGLNQNALEEIRAGAVSLRGISVVRRITGGGAVYHDLGNLNFSFVTDVSAGGSDPMRRFIEPVAAYLNSLGLPAEADGRNDITVCGKKVSGNAERIFGERMLHHGTLLFQSDLAALAQVLKPPDDKFQSKSTKSVRSRVGNISELLPSPMPFQAFKEGLVRWLSKGENLAPWKPSLQAEAEIQRLSQEKYASDLWNYGHAPDVSFKNRRRFSGGSLEICLLLEGGRICEAKLYGDFLAAEAIEPLTAALRGTLCTPEDVRGALRGLPLSRLLGGITEEEFLSVLF